MPIFAYRCDSCGFEKDVLQKRSDPALSECPSCGQPSFNKRLTAPAFQLKGSGWYVTDFRDNGKKPGADGGSTKEGGSTKDGGSTQESGAAKDGGGSAGASTAATPAPAAASTPAPAPAPAPSAPSGGGGQKAA